MKLTKEKLKQIIKEELREEKSDKQKILDDLQRLLDEWQEKVYSSDKERYEEYYKDVQKVVDGFSR